MAKVELLDDVDRALMAHAVAIPYGPGQDQTPSIILDERKLLQCALDEPYEGEDISKMGLSKMASAAKSVANQAADGIPWAIEFVFNRLYGRPKQTINTANLNMTLKDYLQHLAQSATAAPGAAPLTPDEAEIVNP